MELGLQGKTALVTGTGSQVGFGRGVALFLAQEGCDIASADLNFEGATKTASDVAALGRKSIAVKVDITNRADIDQAVAQTLAEFGKIDILVNTAGASIGVFPFVESTPDQWDSEIDLNLKGTMGMMHAVLPQMIKQKYGRIVNFSTHCANHAAGLFGVSPYIAAKAGLSQMSKSLQHELGDIDININIVAPGPGDTNFHRAPSMAEDVARRAAQGKTVLPSDIAHTVAFLVSDVARLVRGQVVEVCPYLG
jgi:2-hydroxycyclohexanecarboxyl-CoA dehydrogenase